MSDTSNLPEIRVVLEVNDVASLAELLGETLGLREVARFGEHDQEAVILEAGRATIELGNRAHIEHIDDLEKGTSATRVIRLAVAVDHAVSATGDVSRSGELSVIAGLDRCRGVR